jgi:hypothetical protein
MFPLRYKLNFLYYSEEMVFKNAFLNIVNKKCERTYTYKHTHAALKFISDLLFKLEYYSPLSYRGNFQR